MTGDHGTAATWEQLINGFITGYEGDTNDVVSTWENNLYIYEESILLKMTVI